VASYRVEWKNTALRELKQLDRQVLQRLVTAAEGIASDPRPVGARKLTGSDHTYRIRVGDYRIVYEISDDDGLVEIVRVRHRRDAYR
jgi:mRNA interferase RelE/StbE